jgi:hypothetical protein
VEDVKKIRQFREHARARLNFRYGIDAWLERENAGGRESREPA